MEILHIILEAIAGILGIISFILVYPLWLKHKKPFFLGLTLWTSVSSSLTFFHLLFYFITELTSSLPFLSESGVAFTYLPERILDSVILYFTVYHNHLKLKLTYFIMAISLLGMFVFTIFNPMVYHTNAVIGRPIEMFQIIPAAFVLGNFINVVKPATRRLSLVVLVTLINGLLMGLSQQYFDVWFTLAHVCKVISYSLILYTIIWIKSTIDASGNGESDIYGSSAILGEKHYN